MPLTTGTRLGSYIIETPLGAGGMGEVYRARDTRLNRDLALKILPELFLSDPERRARFEREATTLASLNHPHIAQIHGFEENGGRPALVMELVDGEDLSQRLRRGPIPFEEVLAIAEQMADALEGAHDRGIVHRDLKPANIKIRGRWRGEGAGLRAGQGRGAVRRQSGSQYHVDRDDSQRPSPQRGSRCSSLAPLTPLRPTVAPAWGVSLPAGIERAVR